MTVMDPRPFASGQPDLRSVLAGGGIALGTFTALGSPVAVEVLAHSGLDLLCIDAEHGAFGPAEIEGMLRGTAGSPAAALVRVGEPGAQVAYALDAGAIGIVFPRVDSAEYALACVAQTRYPPVGTRGSGPGRATGYGAYTPDYVAWANDHVLAIAQIETVAGVENAREIAHVAGVDAILVGPNDLAVSMGVPKGAPEHVAAMEHVVAVAVEARVPAAILCAPGEVAAWRARGVRLFFLQSDIGLLRAAAQAAVSAATEEGARHG